VSFEQLFELAQSKLRPTESSGFISCGQVSAAIETSKGNHYVGVCIDTACSIGMCAERNAVGSMLTEGEFQITKLVCIKSNGVILPCGVCRELLMQVHPKNAEMEILADDNGSVVKLSDLMPKWWGSNR